MEWLMTLLFGTALAGGILMMILVIALSFGLIFLIAWGFQYSLEYWASYRKRRTVTVNYWIAFIVSLVLGLVVPYLDALLLLGAGGTWIASLFMENPWYRTAATPGSVPAETPNADPAAKDQE